jgi:hypothetical protein
MEAAHLAVSGPGPGRRAATQHLNDAYIVLIAAHFQQFCRDLHTEAVASLAGSVPHLRYVVEEALVLGRQLDRGNATPSSLGADYKRLGMNLWADLESRDRRTAARMRRLEQLNIWRNAVAHGDFRLRPHAAAAVDSTARTLAFARCCRGSCQALARQFDAGVAAYLRRLLGASPW